MSKQYPGGIISKTAPVPSGPYSTDTAPGIWTLEQQAYWQKLGQWPNANNPPVDPQFNYVTMLLHGDGTNGAQNNTFLDSSTNNFTITRNGNTTQGSFSPYGSNWSNYFGGTDTYLQLASNASINPQTSDFCLEAWIYATTALTTAYQPIYSGTGTGAIAIGQLATGLFGVRARGVADILSRTSPSTNQWVHIAVTRSGTSLRMFYNGVQQGATETDSTDFVTGIVTIGNFDSGSFGFSGFISNLRFVKGSAVYTSNFTPSTTPLTAITNTQLLTCQSNRFVDNSANNFAITVNLTPSVQRFNPFGASTAYSTSVIGGSGYFDGTGDNLSFASGTGFDVRTGDFTIECWVNPNSTSQSGVVGNLTNNNGLAQWQIFINYAPSNKQVVFLYGTTTSYLGNVLIGGNAGTLSIGSWNHIAVTRSGTTIRVFLNGVVVATDTTGNSFYDNNPNSYKIGSHGDSSEYTNGYITNVRVIQGTALYTSAFTPPTAPLTAVSGTSVLTNMTNGAIFDNAMMNNLETVGNAQISTSVVKYGTGSLAFDGSGDWLSIAGTPNLAFGTGNFTIELWAYRLSGTNNGLFQLSTTAGGFKNNDVNNLALAYASGGITYYANNNSYVPSTTVSNNQWDHLALVRSGTTTTLYFNGVSVSSITDSTNYTGTHLVVGGYYDTTYVWNGYIDDLRITKGYARYTANFTPPTAAFFNYGPT